MVVNGDTTRAVGSVRGTHSGLRPVNNVMIVAQYSAACGRANDTFLNAQAGQERGRATNVPRTARRAPVEFARTDAGIDRAPTAPRCTGRWLLRRQSAPGSTSVRDRNQAPLENTGPRGWTKPRSRPATSPAALPARDRAPATASITASATASTPASTRNITALGPLVLSAQRARAAWRRCRSRSARCAAADSASACSSASCSRSVSGWVQTQFVKLAGVYKFDFRIAYLIPADGHARGVGGAVHKRRTGVGRARFVSVISSCRSCDMIVHAGLTSLDGC